MSDSIRYQLRINALRAELASLEGKADDISITKRIAVKVELAQYED